MVYALVAISFFSSIVSEGFLRGVCYSVAKVRFPVHKPVNFFRDIFASSGGCMYFGVVRVSFFQFLNFFRDIFAYSGCMYWGGIRVCFF